MFETLLGRRSGDNDFSIFFVQTKSCDTWQGASESGRKPIKLRFEGERQLSGRVEPVHVYSVDEPLLPAQGVGADDHAELT